jgi:hypothetical protein
VKPTDLEIKASAGTLEPGILSPDLADPRVVLSFLEADQVVAAKQRTHFGRRTLSLGVRVMLWGLRIYVIVMLVLVIVSAIRALHLAP